MGSHSEILRVRTSTYEFWGAGHNSTIKPCLPQIHRQESKNNSKEFRCKRKWAPFPSIPMTLKNSYGKVKILIYLNTECEMIA